MVWDRTKQPDSMTYQSYCWFIYNDGVSTIKSIFPPTGREDVYGGKTGTEIRSLAFEKLNDLERKYGSVTVETI